MNFLISFVYFWLGVSFLNQWYIKVLGIGLLIFTHFKNKKPCKYFFLYCLLFSFGLTLGLLSLLDLSFNSQIGIVIVSKNNYFVLQTITGRYYVYNESNTFEVFDILKVNGEVSKTAFTYYESQFNFNEYLRSYGVNKTISSSSINTYFLSLFRIKSLIKNNLVLYDETTQSILSTLLFNLSTSKEYSSLINSNNLNYYLSISSFHVYFLLEISEKLLGIKYKDKTVQVSSIVFSILFLIISNYKLSLIKLVILKILTYLNYNKFKIKRKREELLGITFLFIGIIFPSYLKSSSFYYSLPLYLLLTYSKEASKSFRKDKRKGFYIILINLYFIPLFLIDNGYFCLLSLPFSLLISPIIIIIFILGVLGLLVPLGSILKVFSKGLYCILYYFDKINLKIYSSYFNEAFILIYYLCLLVIIYLIETKRKKKIVSSILVMASTLIFSLIPLESQLTSYIAFINVGQGDSTLIVNRGRYYLVDTGGVTNNDLAKNTLIPYFKKKGIYHLDCLFITHSDYDHCGAKDSLIANFKINEVIENNDFKVKNFVDISFTNLNVYSSLWNEPNDTSLVLYTTINDKKILLMGDAPSSIEKRIVSDYPNLQVDYLKLGHHGSNTSSCYEFLNAYKPKINIISCGLNNKYNHPNDEVLNRLNRLSLNYRRTDKEGTIVLKL